MRFSSVLSRITIASILASTSAASYAASGTTSFDVSIQVLSSCSISASNLTFSSISTGTTSNTDATSSLTVNCSNGTPYSIALDNGTNYSAGRRLASGASYINYYLYSDSGRATQWNTASVKSGTGSGSDQTLTVFGRVPSGQSVTNTGSYADTVIATITY